MATRASKHLEVTLKPAAVCQNAGCPFVRKAGATTLADAKVHCMSSGHDVLVSVETRTLYVCEAN